MGTGKIFRQLKEKMDLKLFVLIFAALAVASAFKWKNCNRNAPARITKMNVHPKVLPMKTGAKITASGEMINNARPPSDAMYTIKVKVHKKAWVWVPLPCIKFLGSCTYEHLSCKMLKDKFPLLSLPCPLPPGTHTLPQNTVTVPDVSKVPSWIRGGQYKLKAELIQEGVKKTLMCLEVEVKVNA